MQKLFVPAIAAAIPVLGITAQNYVIQQGITTPSAECFAVFQPELTSFEGVGLTKTRLLPFFTNVNGTIVLDIGLPFAQRDLNEFEDATIYSVLRYLEIQMLRLQGADVSGMKDLEESYLAGFAEYATMSYSGILSFVLYTQLNDAERILVMEEIASGVEALRQKVDDQEFGSDLMEYLRFNTEVPDEIEWAKQTYPYQGIPDYYTLMDGLKTETASNIQALRALGFDPYALSLMQDSQLILFGNSNLRTGMQVDMKGGDLQLEGFNFFVRVDEDANGNISLSNLLHELRHLWQYLVLTGNQVASTKIYSLPGGQDRPITNSYFHALITHTLDFLAQVDAGEITDNNSLQFADILNYLIYGDRLFKTVEIAFLADCFPNIFTYRGVLRANIEIFKSREEILPDYMYMIDRQPNRSNAWLEFDAQVFALVQTLGITLPPAFEQFYLP